MMYSQGAMSQRRTRTYGARRYPYRRRTTSLYRSPYTRRQDMVPTTQGWSFNRLNRSSGGAQRVEWKFSDRYEIGLTTMPLIGQFYLLNGLVPGSGASQRIGTMITMKTVETRAIWIPFSSATIGLFRFFIVLDHQANGVTPLLSDIMAATGIQFASGLRNLNTRQRYRILMDKTYGFNNPNFTTSQPYYMHHYMRFRLPVTTQYNSGSAGSVGDIVTNALYFIATTTAAASATPSFQMLCRLRYTDA
ncbi:coat protein [Lake Sarah-associated circular virus-42]|uniref:coat protein n=1 Tax=Lake Sarah-associated circular virus-42 TaxID=1685771 RepID=UPI000777C1E7|nr:coat protein [Lake Sarah-associated circular virus-42]ALE29786.1 coat protein [Lake Sarah-associated circular virus-42]ALE29787.1 coat protein [Lake Sarah-associated circular virus-42]ALE29790.1 coat protein [Lake Sarah-associated circular virus-42]